MKNRFELHFEIERNCMLKCKHCSSHLIRDSYSMGYSIEDIILLIQFLSNNELSIFFTGGEPLLNNNLIDTIKTINSEYRCLNLGIFTSGLLYDESRLSPLPKAFAKQLQQAGLNTCYISVYGSNSLEHDFMTDIAGSFELTTNAILNLIASGIEVRFNTVIFQKNENRIPELLDYAKKVGASEVRLLKLVRHGNAINNWDCLKMTNNHKYVLNGIIKNSNHCWPRITISGYPSLVPCRPFSDAIGCEAGIKLLYITYMGDLYPCACTKNNPHYKICHITELASLKHYLLANKSESHSCLSETQFK